MKSEKNVECVCAGLIEKRKKGIHLIKGVFKKNRYVMTIKSE